MMFVDGIGSSSGEVALMPVISGSADCKVAKALFAAADVVV